MNHSQHLTPVTGGGFAGQGCETEMTDSKHKGIDVHPHRRGFRGPAPTSRVRLRLCRAAAVLLCILVLILVSPEQAVACPTCKEGLANGHDGVSLGYYWSILFMMAMPFLIFASWAFFIWRAVRKQPRAGLQPLLHS